jgi:hypothetical protein
MKGADLEEAMASAVDRIVRAREGASALDRAIEAVVGTIGRFRGKNATSYLEAYRAEMVMRNIPEDRRLAGFPRVAMPSIHTEVLGVRDESRTWEEFEGSLLEKYGHDDALQLSKHDFMEWVETPEKGRSASALLWEFKERFAHLSALDRAVLDTGRVLLFVKSVDARDREKVGLLLETNDGLTAVENQAQRRRTVTAIAAVGRIRVNGIWPVGTDGGGAVGRIGENRIRPVVLDSRISANWIRLVARI